MFLTIAAALQIAGQPPAAEAPPPPPPPAIAYLHIAGGEYRPVKPVEQVLRRLEAETSATRLHRAGTVDTAPFNACLSRSSSIDDAEGCVRALLPRLDGGAPVVAVFVEEDLRPNIIGTVVNKSLTVRCVGYRAVAKAELDTLDRAHQIDAASGPIRQCLAAATRTPAQATVADDTGAATWRFPLNDGGLIRDLPLARGNALERAIVEVDERWIPGRTAGGDCVIYAQVTRVLGGWWLRQGDRIATGLPCGTNGARKRQAAHLMIGFDRKLRYLEPL